MKKITLSIVMMSLAITLIAQSPQAFNYQMVVRDATGEIVSNQNIGIRISIHDDTPGGPIIYQEEYNIVTNQFGLVNLEIGNGTSTLGEFHTINWGKDAKFLQVEIDLSGGSDYFTMGTSQLLSVPYALHAETVANAASEINGLSDAKTDTTSMFLGLGAGENDDGKNYNTVLGVNALYMNTDRYGLVAVGDNVLKNNGIGATEPYHGTSNTALGSKSMYSNTTGNQNTASGYQSLYSNTTGAENTASGYESLFSNTTGYRNTANGIWTLYSNTTGEWNTANGYLSMYSNTTGYENTASGYKSLYSNTTGYHNTATGAWSLNQNTTGIYNTAIGIWSLYSNTTGDRNTASGYGSLYSNTTGERNTAFGHSALYSNTTGNLNTATGVQALTNNTTGTYNTATGTYTLRFNTEGIYNTASGYDALYFNTTGDYNTATGAYALHNNTTGYANTATGYAALTDNTTGEWNTANGYLSMYSHTTGWGNTSSGYQSLYTNTSGNHNTAIGLGALLDNTTGYDNTASGSISLRDNTTGWGRTALGRSANSTGTAYNYNTGLGYDADCTSSDQVRIGDYFITSIGGYVNWTNISDQQFKKNVSEDVKGLSFITKLRPVTYFLDLRAIDDFFVEHYNVTKPENLRRENGKEQIRYTGFIAQEVEQAATEAGFDFSGVDPPKNEDDFYGLRYAEFVVPLVKAVQEQQEMIEELEIRIEELKKNK